MSVSKATANNWYEANQRYLMAAIGLVREELECKKSGSDNNAVNNQSACANPAAAKQIYEETADDMPSPAALDIITSIFGLSPFERNILVLCACWILCLG